MKIDIARSFFRWYLKDKISCQDEINIGNIDTILILTNTAIGDTLFTTPAIRLIKEKYPNKKIIALLNPNNYELFENNPYIDLIILYRGKWRNFLNVMFKLRRQNIDLALIMHSNEPQATPLAYCSGGKYIIKIPNDQNEFRFLHHNPPVSAKSYEHFIDRGLKQIEYLDVFKKSYKMDIFLKEEWKKSINGLLNERQIHIGFQIGASSISRMWFLDNWTNLAKKVLSFNKNWHIVLTGSKVDQYSARSLCSNIQSDRIIDLTGRFSLGPAAALISKLDLLVTPDTGPLHIAAAVNTTTLAISVAGIALESNPRSTGAQHIFIQKPKTCSPCIDKKCKYQKCMYQITVNEVFENICNVLISN